MNQKITSLLDKINQWGQSRKDIKEILLVGSHATDRARDTSDVDLVILTDFPERYIENCDYVHLFGTVITIEKEDWGKVTSIRCFYKENIEVEFGITYSDWNAQPYDPGTKLVLDNGYKTIYKRRV